MNAYPIARPGLTPDEDSTGAGQDLSRLGAIAYRKLN